MTHRTLSLLLACLLLAACGNPQKPGTLADALADYNAGRYDAAYASASRLTASRQDRGKTAEQARYLAGLSAYQLGNDTAAIDHLEPLTRHADRAMAGPANAHLGLLHDRRGHHEQALTYFSRATQLLDGNDKAQAHYHMALTQQKLGRHAQSVPNLTLAASLATDPALKAAAENRQQTSGFTLQFGAYTRHLNAQSRAKEVGPLTRRAKIGDPRIVTLEADGRTLHHVQAGRFGSYDAALAAKRTLALSSNVSIERLTTQ